MGVLRRAFISTSISGDQGPGSAENTWSSIFDILVTSCPLGAKPFAEAVRFAHVTISTLTRYHASFYNGSPPYTGRSTGKDCVSDLLNLQEPIRPFGVGCFNFRFRGQVPYTLTPDKYVQTLRLFLERLPALTDLEIEFDEESGSTELHISEHPPSLSEGIFFPELPGGVITFRLYIPERVQIELIGNELRETDTESFTITIRHWFYGAVTFVECLDAGENCHPSTAVQVVREFLAKELPRLGDEIEFECLGPSPFHMDFFARHCPSQSEDLVISETRLPGYDRMDVAFRDNVDPVWSFYHELSAELDLYYALVLHNRRREGAWSVLREEWEKLRQSTSEKYNLFNVKSRIAIHHSSEALIESAFAFAVEDEFSKQHRRRMLDDEYDKELKSHFHRYTNKVSALEQNYPVQPLIDWANHVHESSFKAAEIFTVLIAAIFGGVVGAGLTSMLAK